MASHTTFEKLEPNIESEYDEFLKIAYPSLPIIPHTWRWKYKEYPYASEIKPLIYLCRYQNQLIAQLCVMPVSLVIDKNLFRGGWFQDFIILPQFRNKGLGYFLVQHTLQEIRAYCDVGLVGGTSDQSFPVLKYSQFKHIDFMKTYIKAVHFQNVAKHYTSSRILQFSGEWGLKLHNRFLNFFSYPKNSYSLHEVETESEFKDMGSLLFKKFRCYSVRDEKVLYWRFKKHPLSSYKIFSAKNGKEFSGYMVLRTTIPMNSRLKGLRVGIVVDIFFNDLKTAKFLLQAAIDYFGQEVDLIRCDTLQNFDFLFTLLGFQKFRSPHRFLIYPFRELNSSYVMNSKHWYITYGDSDFDL